MVLAVLSGAKGGKGLYLLLDPRIETSLGLHHTNDTRHGVQPRKGGGTRLVISGTVGCSIGNQRDGRV